MNTTAQVKQAIKKSTNTFSDEPLEILKTARDQILGSENYPQQTQENNVSQNNGPTEDETNYKKQIAEQDGRHLEALENELRDIRRQKTFNDLMQKIQGGEDVSLEEFSELTHEQRDVLKAQIEAVKKQRIGLANQNSGLNEPAAKKGRRFGGMGQKKAAEKQQTRVENPVQSST